MRRRRAHRVVAVACDGVALFELAIAVEVFGLPRPELRIPWYQLEVCSPDPGPLSATGGVRVKVGRGLEAISRADTVIVPSWRSPGEQPPERLLAALRRAHRRGARVVSICSGAFVLAAAGLLDGRRATTHWRYAERLRAAFPSVEVLPDVLYVDEGRVLTSAGSAAGIDLCLHLVRLDHGARIANQVARRLVVSPHREGGQAQYVAQPVPTRPGHGLARAIDWAIAHLDRPIAVEDLARAAALTPRTLVRRFGAEMGCPPHRWLVRQRVLAAQRVLEESEGSIEEVAAAVGFETAQTLRLHFRRLLRTTPTAYRRRFSTGPREASPMSGRPRSQGSRSGRRSPTAGGAPGPQRRAVKAK